MDMNWLWLLLPVLIAVLALLAWWYGRYRRLRPQPPPPAPNTEPAAAPREEPPFGWLLQQGAMAERHAIMAFPWRIGRSSRNDLCIDDPSISRRHAEVRRNEDGHALIVDLESLNGIYINNEKTGRHILREGDRVEIGDIVFHYTLLGEAPHQSPDQSGD